MLQREIRDREGEVLYVKEQNTRMEQANAQILRKIQDLRADLEAKQNEYIERRAEGDALEDEVRRN